MWRHSHFTNLWLTWSNPKAGFWLQSVKLTFWIIVTFYLTKFENRAKKSLTQLSHYWFKESYFVKKMLTFCKKCFLTSAKLRVSWYWKVYFLKLHMYVYLYAKFQVSSIILTGFRQRDNLSPPQNEPLKSPPRLGLSISGKQRERVKFIGRNSKISLENQFLQST